MMRQYELVERVQRYKPDVNEALLNKAYVYAMQKHGHQKRASGDPYFSHPLEVAAILTDMHLDEATIAIALLHDTIEDTSATRQEIDTLFGPDIGKLVEGLTKLKKLDLVSKKAVQAENLRKLLLAISDDVRVLLVKLADRLHNMRTLHHVPPDKRLRISEETMDIYAPLAGRMGMQDMREELEGLAFRYINPEAFNAVTNRLAELMEKNRSTLTQIETDLSSLFEKRGIKASVKSRQKKAWSVFRKMESKGLSFEQLSDIFGFRVVVDTVADCYNALGIIHTTWSMVPGRIYKDRGSAQNPHVISTETNAYAWLRQTIEALAEGDNPEEFLEHTKLELFQDQVFCFTPEGRLIALPRGATPIDFAYAVHTNIGDSCVGAKVNGRIMPLMTELHNGDEVEIIRSKAQTPPAAWESVVVTGKARAAIRRATRIAVRKQYSGLGTQILERAFERAGKVYSRDELKKGLPRLARKEIDDVLAAVGRGELPSSDVMKAVYPEYQDSKPKPTQSEREEGWVNFRNTSGMIFKMPEGSDGATGWEPGGPHALPIRGASPDMPVHFSPEGAVPGDRIVGILQPGAGMTIYPIQSSALMAYDDQPERWIDVRWDIDESRRDRFPARINISAINAPGSLAEIAEIIAANETNIHNLSMVRTAPDFTQMIVDLEVWDLKHLNRILSKLKESKCVSDAQRVNG